MYTFSLVFTASTAWVNDLWFRVPGLGFRGLPENEDTVKGNMHLDGRR